MQLNPIYYNEQHIAFADNVRRFVQKEMAPFVNEWDEAETFPRELYKKAAEIGLLGLGFQKNMVVFQMQIHSIHYWLVSKWQRRVQVGCISRSWSIPLVPLPFSTLGVRS